MLLVLIVLFLLDTDTASTRVQLVQYLQPDDVDSGRYDIPANSPHNSCTRPCRRGNNMTCYYSFVFEPYAVLGKLVSVSEYKAVIFCKVYEGDTIVVDVKNMMPGRSTAVHWHGVRQQNSKFMDGVPMVTQCPIEEPQIFRYNFPAEDPGLHFYHSHEGLQKADGIVGSLVIRKPRDEDPNSQEYDFDLPSHIILVQDWYHRIADGMFPTTYLIQGKGQYITANGTKLANTPIAEFNVQQGLRYVFRIIAGTCFECQYLFTVENHDMVVIGADAQPTKPYWVNSLTMSSGERFSVVINANQPVEAYWMQVRSVGVCRLITKANQVAVLRYEGEPRMPSTPTPTHVEYAANRVGLTVNPFNSNCTRSTQQRDGPCVAHLRGVRNVPDRVRQRQPDMRIVWAFGFYYFTAEELLKAKTSERFLHAPFQPVGSMVNGMVNMLPPAPILSQPNDVPRNIICPLQVDYSAWNNTWNTVHRECVHIMKVPINSVVEIVAIDTDDYEPDGIPHPVHLHGYDMYMMEQGIMPQGMPFNQSYLQLMRYLDSTARPAIAWDLATKDTYTLTAGGYAVTRIIADNPGYWFFHCYLTFHLDTGMSGILQVAGGGQHLPLSSGQLPHL